MNNEQIIFNFLMEALQNKKGVCALMGNLKAEGNGNPKNLENYYEGRLGYTDDSYTKAVDSNSYTRFVYDSAGYGLAQWTYWTRKQKLYNYAKSKNVSIGNITMQLEFLIKELKEDYTAVYNNIIKCTDLKATSDYIMAKFENPANQSENAKNTRASYGQDFYNRLNANPVVGTTVVNPKVTYQIWDDVKNAWLSNVVNDNDFAGIQGHDICCIYANANIGNIYQKVHYKGGKWLPEVKNRTDYAGIKNKPIDAWSIKSDKFKIAYRGHLRRLNKWLPWVTGYNVNDSNNGYAGIFGEELDEIQIKIIK